MFKVLVGTSQFKDMLGANVGKLVITRFPVPVPDTAANMPNSGLHVTPLHSLSAGDAWDTQFTPSTDVMIRSPVPLLDTATNILSSLLHSTLVQLLSTG
jgi:hypothetical protein